MKNSPMQRELLSDVRTAAQVLNFALSRERGLDNQRELLRSSTSNWNAQVGAISNNPPRQQQAQQATTNKELCWRCVGIFAPGHIAQCTAEQAQCSICKKTSPFAKICCSKIPPLPKKRYQSRGGYQRPQGPTQSQIRVHQIQGNLLDEGHNDQTEEESVDPESTLYICELTEDRAEVKHIISNAFSPMKNSTLNKKYTRKKYGSKQQQPITRWFSGSLTRDPRGAS